MMSDEEALAIFENEGGKFTNLEYTPLGELFLARWKFDKVVHAALDAGLTWYQIGLATSMTPYQAQQYYEESE